MADEKSELVGTIQEVYRNPSDKEAGIPPLFLLHWKITDVDMTRFDQLKEVKVEYTTKT